MNGNKVRVGEEIMTNVQGKSQETTAISGAALLTTMSGTLILLGIAFQLAEIGYRRLHTDNMWPVSIIASGLWNILSLGFNTPALQELLHFWPLLLVGCGLAIMLAARENRSRTLAGRPIGERHGE
jgi:hypothetical protein